MLFASIHSAYAFTFDWGDSAPSTRVAVSSASVVVILAKSLADSLFTAFVYRAAFAFIFYYSAGGKWIAIFSILLVVFATKKGVPVARVIAILYRAN